MRDFFREHCLKSNLLQLSHSMFGKNVARLAVAMGCHTWIRSLATAKRAIFLQNILWESCSKFYFKQYFLKNAPFPKKVTVFKICYNFPTICSVRISLIWQLLGSITGLSHVVTPLATARLAIFLQNILWEC